VKEVMMRRIVGGGVKDSRRRSLGRLYLSEEGFNLIDEIEDILIGDDDRFALGGFTNESISESISGLMDKISEEDTYLNTKFDELRLHGGLAEGLLNALLILL
jgi:hypothetical protein